MSEYIHFIITGGTIDSEYEPTRETSVPSRMSSIPEYIRQKIKPYARLTFQTLCMLDSGDITDEHRTQMVQMIARTPAQKIIITHGTNTMTQTAEFLQKSAELLGKTVVLVGSMIPLKEFAMSDAGFNLGFALSQVMVLGDGVYICMHGETFKAGDVRKNFERARFEHLQTERILSSGEKISKIVH